MNKLMLTTMSVKSENTEELDHIFSLWEQNALLLCMEANNAEDEQASSRMEELASALKMKLTWTGTSKDISIECRPLFYSALQEAIVNAAKHAKAKELHITISKNEAGTCCSFENGGVVARGEVKFTGGLSNLARLVQRKGATVTAETGERFVLTIVFPKQNQPIG